MTVDELFYTVMRKTPITEHGRIAMGAWIRWQLKISHQALVADAMRCFDVKIDEAQRAVIITTYEPQLDYILGPINIPPDWLNDA